jgi:hypothetical protein
MPKKNRKNCLPTSAGGRPRSGCGHARRGRRPRWRHVVVLVVVLVAALLPVALIKTGMTPAAAMSTAGAIAAFAFGVAHQVLHLLGGTGRRAAATPGNA